MHLCACRCGRHIRAASSLVGGKAISKQLRPNRTVSLATASAYLERSRHRHDHRLFSTAHANRNIVEASSLEEVRESYKGKERERPESAFEDRFPDPTQSALNRNVMAVIRVQPKLGSLASLFAVVREVERRFGPVAEYRCSYDDFERPTGVVNIQFKDESSLVPIPLANDQRKPDRRPNWAVDDDLTSEEHPELSFSVDIPSAVLARRESLLKAGVQSWSRAEGDSLDDLDGLLSRARPFSSASRGMPALPRRPRTHENDGALRTEESSETLENSNDPSAPLQCTIFRLPAKYDLEKVRMRPRFPRLNLNETDNLTSPRARTIARSLAAFDGFSRLLTEYEESNLARRPKQDADEPATDEPPRRPVWHWSSLPLNRVRQTWVERLERTGREVPDLPSLKLSEEGKRLPFNLRSSEDRVILRRRQRKMSLEGHQRTLDRAAATKEDQEHDDSLVQSPQEKVA